jgi:hypothetical protein
MFNPRWPIGEIHAALIDADPAVPLLDVPTEQSPGRFPGKGSFK